MTAPSPLSRAELENLALMLQCPISLERYSDQNKAVSLVANDTMFCGHTVCEKTARQILEKPTPRCPLCRRTIVRMCLNPLVNDIAATLLATHSSGDRLLISEKIAPEPNIEQVPFPGKGARFELKWGWEKILQECVLRRRMEFKSQTQDSVFKGFTVLGDRDGTIRLFLDWQQNELGMKRWKDWGKLGANYLLACGLRVDPFAKSCYFGIPREIAKAFRVLATHNEIPEPHFTFIRRLVEVGNWQELERMGEECKS